MWVTTFEIILEKRPYRSGVRDTPNREHALHDRGFVSLACHATRSFYFRDCNNIRNYIRIHSTVVIYRSAYSPFTAKVLDDFRRDTRKKVYSTLFNACYIFVLRLIHWRSWKADRHWSVERCSGDESCWQSTSCLDFRYYLFGYKWIFVSFSDKINWFPT